MKQRLPTTHRAIRSGWAVWGFALALLLKAAVPLLASASATLQGKALAEVCTVYGVATAAPGGQDSLPASDHGVAAHGGEQCPLTALTASSAPERPQLVRLPQTGGHPMPLCGRPGSAPDACAAWMARLEHGPPALA